MPSRSVLVLLLLSGCTFRLGGDGIDGHHDGTNTSTTNDNDEYDPCAYYELPNLPKSLVRNRFAELDAYQWLILNPTDSGDSEYDEEGRLIRFVHGEDEASVTYSWTLSYTDTGKLATGIYDEAGSAEDFILRFDYYPHGLLERMTRDLEGTANDTSEHLRFDNSSGRLGEYIFDAAGDEFDFSESLSYVYVGYALGGSGFELSRWYRDGAGEELDVVESFEYDDLGRLERWTQDAFGSDADDEASYSLEDCY